MQLQNYEQFAVYWTTEGGWNTELHLRNNLPAQDLTVTPALRTADGAETALPAVTIHSADVVTVDLRAVITSAAPQLLATYGSIVFRYQAPVPRALYAALMIGLPGTPIEFHMDAFLQPYKWVTGSREGIWWQPRDSLKDFLVLTNTGDSAVDANLILYDPSGKAWQQKLTLGARQTTRLSVRNLLQQAGLTGSFGGIKIDAGKGAGYLDSAHFVYDESSGFLALMKMFDHHPNATLAERSLTDKQWTIRAPMLALTSPDPALALPSEAALQPTILLRNASPNAYTAQITFNWRSDATTGKSTTAVPLQPYETRLVDVAALQKQGAIPANARWAYVSITAPVKPDELLAVAASYDSTGHYGAQTPFTDQVANYWEGGKWEVDATHNTIIAVGNAGTTASKAQLTFYHSTGTGKYQIEKTLAPDEQMWIDVGKLIRDRVADKNGTTIPTSVVSGTYELRSLTNTPKEGLFEGKLVVDKTYGHAAHGCMTCCGTPGKGFMYPDPFNFDLLWYYFDNAYVLGTNPCTGQDDDITAYYTSWWTGNTQVATASMNQITGVGVGSTSNFANGTIPTGGDWESRHCPFALDTPSGGVNVVQLSCTASVTRASSVTCTVSPSTGVTVSNWQFTDANNNTVSRTTNTGSLTWSGTMVTSGTIQVTATPSGADPMTLSAPVTVTNRTTFAFTAVAASKRTNPYSGGACSISVPTSPAAGNAVGYSCLDQQFFETPYLIGDYGPNQGFRYVYSASSSSTAGPTTFNFIIAGYLDDSGSEFAQKQCGNYNPNAGTGYISYAQLKSNTYEHESGNTTGHYATYKSTQDNPVKNIGVAVEAVVGPPGQSEADFNQQVQDVANSKGSTIASAAFPTPDNFCNSDARYDPACVFRGYINWPVYASCQ